MSAISETTSNIVRQNSAPSTQQEEWRTGYVKRMVSVRTGFYNGYETAPDRYVSITRVLPQFNDVTQRLSQSAPTLPDYPGKSANS